jgi:transcription antitermination factor NusG
VETFLPLYNAAHRWKDRVKQLSLPLFPNYVFVRAGFDQHAAILRTPGVYDLVRVSGSPAPIPVEEIEAVRRVVERGLSLQPHPFLKSGDRVRLRTGPLEGVEGVLVRKKNLFRLVISVELLLRSVAVEVDAVDIERAADGDTGMRPYVKWGFPEAAIDGPSSLHV